MLSYRRMNFIKLQEVIKNVPTHIVTGTKCIKLKIYKSAVVQFTRKLLAVYSEKVDIDEVHEETLIL